MTIYRCFFQGSQGLAAAVVVADNVDSEKGLITLVGVHACNKSGLLVFSLVCCV